MEKIIQSTLEYGLDKPVFEELDHFFRVTFFSKKAKRTFAKPWYKPVMQHLEKHGKVLPKEAQKIWKVTPRTAYNRLRQMIEEGHIVEISTGPYDPQKYFAIVDPRK